MLTIMLSSGDSVGASFNAYATACEDSNAGMMPSTFDNVWKPSSTSSFVTDTYSARPIVFKWLCSGPMPG